LECHSFALLEDESEERSKPPLSKAKGRISLFQALPEILHFAQNDVGSFPDGHETEMGNISGEVRVVEETGIVEALRENGLALVKATGGDSCATCKARGACHAFGGGTERRVTAVNRAGATVGDRVILSIGSGAFLKASFLVYLVPVIALVMGSILGERYSGSIWPAADSGLVAAGVGLFCLVVSFVVIRFVNNRLREDRRYYPVIERVIPLSDGSPPNETA